LPKLSGTHWPSLTNSKASIKYAETSRPKPNWDELTKDVEKEEAEAEDGVDKFFRVAFEFLLALTQSYF
jgi:hypothetical protein